MLGPTMAYCLSCMTDGANELLSCGCFLKDVLVGVILLVGFERAGLAGQRSCSNEAVIVHAS